MKKNDINRRDVLKTVSAASAFGLVGSVQGATAEKGSIRLIELGLKYDFSEEHNYQQVFFEGESLYSVEDDTLFLNSAVPDRVRDTFVENNVVINGVNGTAIPPNGVGEESVRAVPSALTPRKEVRELTHLTDPHRLPDVRIEVGGQNPVTIVEGVHQTLETGAEREFTLPARTINAKTYHVTDEIAEIEGVPEHKWGPKTEYGSVEVEAVPTVKVRDRGKLDLRA